MKMKRLRLYSMLQTARIGLTIKVGTLIFATTAMYHQDLIHIVNEALQSELMSYILLIPFLLAYLIYRKRRMLMAVVSSEEHPHIKKPTYMREMTGVLLCIIAFFLYWHGSRTLTPLEYHLLSLPVLIAGCVLLLFGTKAFRVLVFPIAFLLFLTPPPLEIVYDVGSLLSMMSSKTAYTFLKGIGLAVTMTEQYGTPVIVLAKPDGQPLTFAVDIACSGIYSLIGFFIFAVFVTYIARGPLWKKLTLLLLGFPLMYVMNILRIATIVMIGHFLGVELAMQTFHLLGGWILVLVGTLLLLTVSEKVFKMGFFARKSETTSCLKCADNSKKNESFCHACGQKLKNSTVKLKKRDLFKISVIVLVTGLALAIQVPVFALTEGPAGVTVANLTENPSNAQILPEMQNYSLKFMYRDTRFEQIAKQVFSGTYAYIPSTNSSKEIVWATVEIAKSKSSLHSLETCLINWRQVHGSPPIVVSLHQRSVQLIQNPPLPAHFFAFQHEPSDLTFVFLYWFENAVFQSNATMERDFVKISLFIQYVEEPEDLNKAIDDAEEQLLLFGIEVANYWTPIKMWSQLAMSLSQNAGTLLVIATLPIVATIVLETIRYQTSRKRSVTIYNKLSRSDKLIIQAVHTASGKGPATTYEVLSSYNKVAEETIDLSTIVERLNRLKEVGIVELQIANQEDTPIVIWRSRTPIPKSQ